MFGARRKSSIGYIEEVRHGCLLLILLALLCQGCACIRAYKERDDPPPMANWNGPYFLNPGNYGTWTVPKWY
jgi:hypothetical protein